MKPLFHRFISSIWPSIIASVLVGCSGETNESAIRDGDGANTRVFASNFPIAFFADRIGGKIGLVCADLTSTHLQSMEIVLTLRMP